MAAKRGLNLKDSEAVWTFVRARRRSLIWTVPVEYMVQTANADVATRVVAVILRDKIRRASGEIEGIEWMLAAAWSDRFGRPLTPFQEQDRRQVTL